MYNEIFEYHLYGILKQYFTTLAYTGYVSKDIVNKIWTLIGIDELMNKSTQIFITDRDYKSMQRVINCVLDGSCMLPAMKTGTMILGGAYESEMMPVLDDYAFIPDIRKYNE